ncbi:MAG: BREX system ATP-binding domain-containing protein [Acetobacteraceae bacterium]
MTVSTTEWLEILEREYLAGLITAGGAAVKFVVGDDNQLAFVQHRLQDASGRHHLKFISIDAAGTRLHMIQDVFFAVARALDWNALAQHLVAALFTENGYAWPRPGYPVPMQDLAATYRIDETLLRPEINRWLTRDIMRDQRMTQDFRVAMARMCLLQMEPPSPEATLEVPIVQWLKGELRAISALKSAPITAKVTRYNGRAMLRSACQWLRKCGKGGICLAIDIRQLGRTAKTGDGRVHYSPGAVMDAFEVLRQLIDEAEHFSGMQLVVLANDTLTGDDKSRSLDAYPALKMRVWDDVRAEGHDNPLAPLVHLAASPVTALDTSEAPS